MFLNRWKLVLASILFLGIPAVAADLTDQVAYCSYLMEQAQAQRDLLRTPIGSIGFTQPEKDCPCSWWRALAWPVRLCEKRA